MAIPATHVVDLYRPTVAHDATRGTESDAWPASATVSGEQWHVQPVDAESVQRAFGEVIEGMYLAIPPVDTQVQEEDGVKLTTQIQSGRAYPTRYVVKRVDGWGGYQPDVYMQISGESFG